MLRHQVEDALQGEALVGPFLDGLPYFLVLHMELREQTASGYSLEALRLQALALDEVLDHLHPFHIAPVLVHEGNDVLAVLGQVLLRHRADGVGLVDDVVFEAVRVAAVDGEVGTHNHAKHQVLVLVLHGVGKDLTLLLLVLEGQEVTLHGGIVHQGDTNHPRVPLRFNESLVHGNAVNCYDFCHFLIRMVVLLPGNIKRRENVNKGPFPGFYQLVSCTSTLRWLSFASMSESRI